MPSTHLELVRANLARRSDIQGELRSIDEAATTDDNRPYTEAEASRIGELRTEQETLNERIRSNVDMEVRNQEIESGIQGMLGALMTGNGESAVDTRSAGERFTDADGLQAHLAGGAHGNFAVDLIGLDQRAVTTGSLGTGSAGALVPEAIAPRMGQSVLDRRVFLADLLPSTPWPTGSIEIVSDVTPLADLADKAAVVAELAAKPEAGITLAKVQEKIATIAAYTEFSRQADMDISTLRGWLDGRLRYSLRRNRDKQIVAGDGTGDNLLGLTNRSGIGTYAPGVAEDRAVSIRKAITIMELAEAVPEIVVLNPADAEKFDLTNYATAGLHATPDVVGPMPATAWGLRKVHSTVLPAGTALLLDPLAVELFDRMAPTAFITDSHSDRFVKNILTLLLELRVGMGLYTAVGACKITFN